MRILLVEDEAKTSNYLQKGLQEHGFAVDVASDGEQGLQLALNYDYDLLILDVMLPKMDGWSVIRNIRQAGRKTASLFLTARDALDDRVRGLDSGADAYLIKPFAFAELIAQIRSLLRRTMAGYQSENIRVGNLEINVITHEAQRDGIKLDLTPKEFALLLLLARRKNEILSRTTISEKIWDIHFDAESNVVEVHIRRLRSKVDDPWETKLIKTVRGVGYKLEG
jgi:two-component system copper resistance phosphate regulon response regulator CusR